MPGLHAADSYRGHQNPIFAMSYGWHLNFILQTFFYLDAIRLFMLPLGVVDFSILPLILTKCQGLFLTWLILDGHVADDKRNQLISGAKDGTLIVWTADGKVCSYPHLLSWLLHHLSMFLLTLLHDPFE